MSGKDDVKRGRKVRVKKRGDDFGELAVVEDPGKDGMFVEHLATVRTEKGKTLKLSRDDIEAT